MKHLVLTLGAALALSACTRDDDTPAPARFTRTAPTVTITVSRSASTIANDTVLANPRVQLFVLPATANADGTLAYPATTGTGAVAPLATITDFSAPQTFTIPAPPTMLVDGVPALGLRAVATTGNRPGRRNNSQRLTVAYVFNGVARLTSNHTGTNFGRTAPTPASGVFTTESGTNYAGF